MVAAATHALDLLLIVGSWETHQFASANKVPDGFGGADKVFLMEFSMPKDGTTGVYQSY